MLLAIVCFTLLPRSMSSSNYFTAAEKHCSSIRLHREAEIETVKFSWTATLKPLINWHTWMFGLMALFYGVAAASISNFLPTMIKRLTKDTITANLYTIAPNLNGAIWIIAMCWVSDRFQSRAFCSMVAMGVSMIGFICLGTIDLVRQTGLGYFFTFMLTFGVSSIITASCISHSNPSTRRSRQLCWFQPGHPVTSQTILPVPRLLVFFLGCKTSPASSPHMLSGRRMHLCTGLHWSYLAAVKEVWCCWQASPGSTIVVSTSSLIVARKLQ